MNFRATELLVMNIIIIEIIAWGHGPLLCLCMQSMYNYFIFDIQVACTGEDIERIPSKLWKSTRGKAKSLDLSYNKLK